MGYYNMVDGEKFALNIGKIKNRHKFVEISGVFKYLFLLIIF